MQAWLDTADSAQAAVGVRSEKHGHPAAKLQEWSTEVLSDRGFPHEFEIGFNELKINNHGKKRKLKPNQQGEVIVPNRLTLSKLKTQRLLINYPVQSLLVRVIPYGKELQHTKRA